MEEFKLVLRLIYSKFDKIRGDGIVLMHDYLPKMYDKHSLERGKRVSQKSVTIAALRTKLTPMESLIQIRSYLSTIRSLLRVVLDKKPFSSTWVWRRQFGVLRGFPGRFDKVGGIDAIEVPFDRGEECHAGIDSARVP